MSHRRYGRRTVETSNEDKRFFPGAGLSKGDLIDYYERIADRLLPHLDDRPLVVQRFPDGIDGKGFYQKQAGTHFPEWIETVQVELVTSDRTSDLVVCGTKATLVYLVDQGCVTFHPWLSRTEAIDRPDTLVIDLDPSGDDFGAVRRASLVVRDLIENELGLACYPKLTGSSGIHVVAPLDRSDGFDEVRAFASDAMELLAARRPDELTVEQRKNKRGGRLYLDVGRNAYGQTAVAPWSVRPIAGAPIAIPLAWNDLKRSSLGPRDFTVENVFRHVARRDDPWKGMRRRARSLGPARERLDRLRAGSD